MKLILLFRGNTLHAGTSLCTINKLAGTPYQLSLVKDGKGSLMSHFSWHKLFGYV